MSDTYVFDKDAPIQVCPFCKDPNHMRRTDYNYYVGEYDEEWYCENCDNEWYETYKFAGRERK